MEEKRILAYIGTICFFLAFFVLLFYANLFVVNAIRKWMPNSPRRQTLLTGSEEIPTISEHFSAFTLRIARLAMFVLFALIGVSIVAGLISIAFALPLWALIIILILLLK